MIRTYTLLVLVVAGVYGRAQSVEKGLLKVNALLPGLSYELGIADKATLNFDAVIGFALNGGSGRSTEFGVYPSVQAEYRNYINFDRRLRKKKNVSGNTGNYVSLLNQFQFGDPLVGDLEFSSDFYYNIAAVYGIQRTRPKGFYWGLAFGPGIFVDEFDTNVGLLVDARLGWVIGR
ncbi:hypothetical protein ACFQZJ_04820 [Maribacter chungangensis]|uniref:Secreted protein n=1 Tax=Maribacter chungangensis TaxID=1069117 RepID=A0ABW3B0C3_9FLAO